MMKRIGLAAMVLAAAATVRAGEVAFSDPANDIPMPGWAVGQAQRTADLDAKETDKEKSPCID